MSIINNNLDNCPVCLEDDVVSYVKFSCGHMVGFGCFLQMFARDNRNCPICRHNFINDVPRNVEDENMGEEENNENEFENIWERIISLLEYVVKKINEMFETLIKETRRILTDTNGSKTYLLTLCLIMINSS